MAYPYYPMTYQPNYYGNAPYYQQVMQQTQPTQAQQPSVAMPNQQRPPAIQQSGFVLVQSEQDARSYPVAPGNSITFKDERQPYCYVKTMGFNQLDQPTFERYRLVKEDDAVTAQEAHISEKIADKGTNTEYALKSDLTALRDELDALREKIKSDKKTVKREDVDDE